MYSAGALYREFEPCEALRQYVRAYFTFTAPAVRDSMPRSTKRQTLFASGELLCTPLFADGHLSIVFSYGPEYRVDGLWAPGPYGPRGHVIGAMSKARPASHGERVVQVGAFLRAAAARLFTRVPAGELTDQIVAIDALWGRAGTSLEARIGEAASDAERVSILETALLKKIAGVSNSCGSVDLAGIAAFVNARQGSPTVEQLAQGAGVSRQHLTRVFREEVGVTPKLYCRLARFRAGVAHLRGGAGSDWADVAAQLGYADQSHLIADFREFSGLTPGRITVEKRFHPFMENPPGGAA